MELDDLSMVIRSEEPKLIHEYVKESIFRSISIGTMFNYQSENKKESLYFNEHSYINSHQPDARKFQNNNINEIVIWHLYAKLITDLSKFGYSKIELRSELNKCNTVQEVIDLVYSFVDDIAKKALQN